jgi:hypothetical protein
LALSSGQLEILARSKALIAKVVLNKKLIPRRFAQLAFKRVSALSPGAFPLFQRVAIKRFLDKKISLAMVVTAQSSALKRNKKQQQYSGGIFNKTFCTSGLRYQPPAAAVKGQEGAHVIIRERRPTHIE